MGKGLLSYRDFGTPGEVSTVTVPMEDITAANIVTQEGLLTTFQIEMEKLILGGQEQRAIVVSVDDTKTAPSGGAAQRENKWLVRYHDSAGKYTMEIPTADLSKLDPNANDKILMTNADVVSFIAAFEAVVTQGNGAVTVDEIIFVTRKS